MQRFFTPVLRLLLMAVIALTVGSPTPVAAASAHGTRVTAPQCTTSELVVWLDTNGNGAAGSSYYNLEFTNLSGHSCILDGYPGVSAVKLSGQQLGGAAQRNRAQTLNSIELLSGQTATAVLQIVDVDNFPSTSCGRVIAAGLRVYPPNERQSKVVPFPFASCFRTGPVFLTVEAVQSSSSRSP